MGHSYVRQLADCSFPSWEKSRVMVMLRGYFDESGTHEGSAAVAVAGYLASDKQWTRFERDWKRVLDEYKIDCFHMTDWESLQGEFCGWSMKRKHELFGKLAAIIRRNIMRGFGAAVSLEGYPAGEIPGLPQAYVVCALSCLFQIEGWADQVKHTEPISHIFEQGSRYVAEIHRQIGYLKQDQPRWEHLRLGSLVFDDKRRLVPLQAADIWAYEEYKEMCNYVVPKTEIYKVRATRTILIKGQEGRYFADHMDKDILRGIDDYLPIEMLVRMRLSHRKL